MFRPARKGGVRQEMAFTKTFFVSHKFLSCTYIFTRTIYINQQKIKLSVQCLSQFFVYIT